MKLTRLLTTLTSAALALPNAAAFGPEDIGAAAGTALDAVGALFSFEGVAATPWVREGILKLLIFVLLLRVVMIALSRDGKPFDRKTAGIIGFVVAAITIVFTPNTFLFSSIVALLIPVLLVFSFVYIAMLKLKKDCIRHFFGAVLLLLNVFLVQYTIQMFQTWNQFEPRYMEPYAMAGLDILLTLSIILFVAKLVQLLFCGTSKGFFASSQRPKSHDQNPHDHQSPAPSEEHEHPEVAASETPPGPPLEEIRNRLPDGHGAIAVTAFAVKPGSRNHPPVRDAIVWLERQGQRLGEPQKTDERGWAFFQLPLPQEEIIVHARKEGYREGVHFDFTHGGEPRHLVALTSDAPVVGAKVPLLTLQQRGPPINPSDYPVDGQVKPDSVRDKDREFTPEQKRRQPGQIAAVDLSSGFFPIEDQKPFPACTAFAAGSMYEYMENVSMEDTTDERRRISKMYYWTRTRIEEGNDMLRWGSFGGRVMDWLHERGVCRASMWPYGPSYTTVPESGDLLEHWLRAENDAPNQMIEEHYWIAKENIANAVQNGYPVFVVVAVYDNLYNNRGGVVVGKQGSRHGAHAVVVVGYHSHIVDGTGGTVPAYKVRNSWGTAWGENGYGWIEEKTLFHLIAETGSVSRIMRGIRRGGQKQEPVEVQISGRVIVDPGNVQGTPTGYDLLRARNLPPLEHYAQGGKLKMRALFQMSGKLRSTEWESVPPDGAFLLSLSFQPELLEPLTAAAEDKALLHYYEGADLSALGPGVIVEVVREVKEGAILAGLHVAPFSRSKLGRGGLGDKNRNNPLLDGNDMSGKPIMFSKDHTTEENVIVPLTGTKQSFDQLALGEKKKIIAGFARKVQENLGYVDKLVFELRRERSFLESRASYHWEHDQFRAIMRAAQEYAREHEKTFESLTKLAALVKRIEKTPEMEELSAKLNEIVGHADSGRTRLRILMENLDRIWIDVQQNDAKQVKLDTDRFPHAKINEFLRGIEGDLTTMRELLAGYVEDQGRLLNA